MPVEAVIFDLDGTIANFNLDYKTLRSEARSYLIRMGIPTSLVGVNESIFEMLKKAEIFLKNNGKSIETFDDVRRPVADDPAARRLPPTHAGHLLSLDSKPSRPPGHGSAVKPTRRAKPHLLSEILAPHPPCLGIPLC